MSRAPVAIGAAVVAAGIAAALLLTQGPLAGESEEGTPEHPKTLPHREYVEKADEVCSDVEVKQAKLDNTIFKGIPFDKSPPDRLYAKYVRELIPTYTEQMDKLRRIAPQSAEERAKLRVYFAKTEEVVALLRKIADHPAKVHLLDDRAQLFEDADNAARALDLKACGHAED